MRLPLALRTQQRGYALAMVMVVLLLLMVAFGGLLTTVAGITGTTADRLRQRSTRLECQGLSRVASAATAQLMATGTATREDIDAVMGRIRLGAARDGMRGVRLEASLRDTGRTNTIATGPLQGLTYAEQLISTRLRKENEDESCRAVTEQPVASFAVTQFASLSDRVCSSATETVAERCDLSDVAYSNSPNTTGFTALGHGVAYSVEPRHQDLPPSALCPGVQYATGGGTMDPIMLSLPFKPANYSSVSPQDFLNNPFTVRAQGLASLGTTGQSMVAAIQKLPMLDADLRIINGGWYKKRVELSLDWPGIPIWSDRFDESTIDANGPRLYSWYERSNGDAALGEAQGRMLIHNRGVVSYGSEYWGEQLARQELCVGTSGACVLQASVDPIEPAEVMVQRATRIDMTRVGFNTPDLQTSNAVPTNTDTKTTRQTTINIDMAFLVTAFNEPTHGELGSHFCLTDGCTGRQFNGIMYVSNAATEYTSSDWGARLQPPVGNNYSFGPGPKNHVLTPLWAPAAFWSSVASLEYGATNIFRTLTSHSGPTIGITDLAVMRSGPGDYPEGNGGHGYNAVRITNAADLTAFVDTGFTFISSMPVFIEGDFNVATDAGGQRAAALIIAPTIIVSTPGVDRFYPAATTFDDPLPGAPSAPTLRVHASLIRTINLGGAPGIARRVGSDPIYAPSDGILSLNPGAIIEIHGALTALPTQTRTVSYTPSKVPRGRVEQHYPLELTTATVRTATDKRLPPGTPRTSFLMGTLTVN